MPFEWRHFKLDDAVRVYLESVSYRNPLPLWNTGLRHRLSAVTEHVQERLRLIAEGTAAVTAPYRLRLPHKPGVQREWIVPSNTEQFLLQACTSDFAVPLCEELDAAGNVYSFRYESSPDDLDHWTDPLEAWIDFQEETRARMQDSEFVLELDLKEAFASIDRAEFFRFLRPRGTEAAVELLRTLLESWDPDGRGIPLVNDSLFFLGNCYLERVDTVVARHTAAFIRFVDDYRVFGDTETELERAYESISRELEPLGFALNDAKVKMSSRAKFFDAVTSIEQHSTADEYYGVRTFLDVISPEQLVRLIAAGLNEPDRYLTVRYGRLIAAELRRVRERKYGGVVYDQFQSLLQADEALNLKAWNLLDQFARNDAEDWRMIWLLHLAEDLTAPPAAIESLGRLAQGRSRIVQVWTSRVLGRCGQTDDLSSLDLSYIDEAAMSCRG